jgi:excinuclease UvrABC ATPase subunit
MKTLRIFAVAPLFIFGTAFTTMAQTDAAHKEHQDITTILTDLTPTQKSKIGEIEKKFKTQLQTVKEDKLITENDKMLKIKSLRQAKQKEIEGVLTDKQKEELKTYKQERKDAKKAAMTEEEKADAIVSRLDKEVTLTANQKTKIQAISTKFIADKNAIKTNSSLSEEAKEAKIKELKKANKLEISNVLTKEQNEILKKKQEEKKASK